MFHVQFPFNSNIPFEFHAHYPSIFRLPQRMECIGVLVYRRTMTFIQSTRPILVISAKRICGLWLYILVNLIAVGICDPTLS